MVAEVNFGGRVTDPKDRRLISVILEDFYSEKILKKDHKFSESGIYYPLDEGDVFDYISYI